MKRQMKNEVGVTLVALVITIIILLILSGISITALTQTNLFKNAKEAKQITENAQNTENDTLASYEEKIGDIVGTRQFDVKDLELDYDNKVDIKSYTSSSNCYIVPQAGIIIVSGFTNNGWGFFVNINEIPIEIIGNGNNQEQHSSYSQLVTKENKIYFGTNSSNGRYTINKAYFIPFK